MFYFTVCLNVATTVDKILFTSYSCRELTFYDKCVPSSNSYFLSTNHWMLLLTKGLQIRKIIVHGVRKAGKISRKERLTITVPYIQGRLRLHLHKSIFRHFNRMFSSLQKEVIFDILNLFFIQWHSFNHRNNSKNRIETHISNLLNMDLLEWCNMHQNICAISFSSPSSNSSTDVTSFHYSSGSTACHLYSTGWT